MAQRNANAVVAAHHAASADDYDDPLDVRALLEQVARQSMDHAPAWLVSLIVHLLLLIALGLWFVLPDDSRPFEVELHFASDLGEQLEEVTVDTAPDPDEVEEEVEEIVVAMTEVPIEEEPLAATIELPEVPQPIPEVSDFVAPSLGSALDGRDPASKSAMLDAYGGTAITEAAVLRGLNWLKRNQDNKNGSWSLKGPYKDGVRDENRESATAMALLAFQGAGHTTVRGEFQMEVRRGTRFLLKRLQDDGNVYRGDLHNHALYTQAQTTMALSELFAMTENDGLRAPTQRAVDFCVRAQSSQGGWRYRPGRDSDVSVTGWFVVALRSAQMAGLDVPSQVFIDAARFLDSCATRQAMDRYGYKPSEAAKPSMTAEALLCRQYLGWPQDDDRLLSGVRYLLDHPIEWRQENVYYWYYATQVLHHMQGDYWKRWNAVMRVETPRRQVETGREQGSWDPHNDRWGMYAGRLFTTCFHIYMLEVYYRHLPIYEHLYD